MIKYSHLLSPSDIVKDCPLGEAISQNSNKIARTI